jgi:23S rRNA pseudouridine1911/1915/1917 synthase
MVFASLIFRDSSILVFSAPMTAPSSPAIRELIVPQIYARSRLDQFLARELPEFSRMRIQKLIRESCVLLNGEAARPRELVKSGDRVSFSLPPLDREPAARRSASVALLPDILFEDDDIIVLNKPAGLTVHAGAGQSCGTLVDVLISRGASLSRAGGELRPGIVHRLDKQTSGCLVVAGNDSAHLDLSRQFAARTVDKIYLALVAGKLRRNSGTIDLAITRHRVHRTKMAVAREGGREARTDFRVVRSGAEASLIECRLHSGRTHQIRVHMQHLGHPILGDSVYAGRRAGNFPRQMLHGWKLAFDHPRTKARMRFEARLPADFRAAMDDVL